jgi:hypothetical protein
MGVMRADRGGFDPRRRALPGSPALLALAFLALGPACRAGRSAPPPERFLAAAPAFALVIPDLGRAAHELD